MNSLELVADSVTFCAGFLAAPVPDELILAIANDRCSPLLMMLTDSGHIYAPYGGGIDLFISDDAQRNELALATRLAGWRSPRPDGL